MIFSLKAKFTTTITIIKTCRSSCPTDIRMTGNMAIFKSSSTQITVCSNVGIENNNVILISNKIEY